MQGSDLRVHSQMLSVALLAMFPWISHPERLRMVSIESFGARLAHTLDMLVEEQATLTFTPGSANSKLLPIEQSVGKSIRISSSSMRFHSRLPCTVCHHHTPQPPAHTTLAHNAWAKLLLDFWRCSFLSMMYSKARYPFTRAVAIILCISLSCWALQRCIQSHAQSVCVADA